MIAKPIVNPNGMKDERNSELAIDMNNANIDSAHEDYSIAKNIPLKPSETIELLTPNNNFYKEYIRNEINCWTDNIPVYLNSNAKVVKNLTNALLEDIVALATNIQDTRYDHQLKLTIDGCLQKLSLFMSRNKCDPIIFKENLSENLFNSIKELNVKLFGSQVANIGKVSENRSINLIEFEITEWLKEIHIEQDSSITKENIAEILLDRLRPILEKPMKATDYKLKLKGEIVGVLDNSPIRLKRVVNKFVYLNRFAEDLANKILGIQCRRKREDLHITVQYEYEKPNDIFQISHADLVYLQDKLKDKLKEDFKEFQINDDNIVTEVINLLVAKIDLLKSGHENSIEKEIFKLICDTCKFTEIESSCIASYMLKSVKHFMDRYDAYATEVTPQRSGIISVYTSKESNFITSTPKRSKKKKETKFTSSEREYTKKISELVRSWIDTLPESKKILADKDFMEIAINDLAGNVMDTIKLSQLTKNDKTEEEHIIFITNIWILKFNLFENTDDAQPFIKQFYENLRKIPIPDLTKSSSGARAMAKNVEFSEKSHPEMKYFPEKLDLIEDQISMWINEQPSEIYVCDGKNLHNKIIHEVAEKLQSHLNDRNSPKDIKDIISKFLTSIVKSKANVEELSNSLSERIKKLPDEKYLVHERKTQQKFKDDLEDKYCMNMEQDVNDEDINETVKDFVNIYAQHFYDVEDSVARGAFEHLLRVAIMKNDPALRKDVYDRMEESTTKQFLNRELVYISMISDWVKNIPVDSSFCYPGNPKRINFINSLARELRGLDEARNEHPDWNYENEFGSIVHGYIKLLPLQEEQERNIPSMINQLYKRVFGSSIQQSISQDNSILNESNLGDFIEEYVLIRAQDVADDEVKLDAWIARLMKEIRKIAREGPNALTFTNVCQKLEGIPVPTEESIKIFELELLYVKEINEWIRNLPLLPINNNDDELNRIDIISDLAEKLAQKTHTEKESYSLDDDEELVIYITTWISKLPLNSNKDINMHIVTKQLLNRIHRINNKDYASVITTRHPAKENINKIISTNKNGLKNDSVKKSVCNRTKNELNKQDLSNLNPGQMLVDAIENWVKNLSISGDDKTVIHIKDDFRKRLFKKIGEFNTNPKIFGDDNLYRALLNEEIDAQLEIIHSGYKLEEGRDKIKLEFINAILEAKKIMEQKSAGDDYVKRLINTLNASIPNPTYYHQMHDPGFEIYKNKLANLFILSNFDHCNDDFKIPYEKKIRREVDKYVAYAATRNAIPLTKDQINNELFSVLFKVPMPNEESIVSEVEELKTKILVDTWYEQLPFEEEQNDLIELLERDKILSTLAKRIYELERREEPTEKILKEIKKWMAKFSFEIKLKCKLDFYANKLLDMLISTKEERKCIIRDTKGIKGKDIRNKKENYETSQNFTSNNETNSYKNTNVAICCQLANFEERNPTELILEIVELWFEKLPLQVNEEEFKTLKSDVVTKIVLKISELNSDSNILYDDITYYALIDQELNKVLSKLPLCCDFPSTSDYKKREFLTALQDIKPLIVNEKSSYEYKKELKDAVGNVLDPPKDINDENLAKFNIYKDELVEDFIQYHYNKEDEKKRLFYKNKIYDLVLTYTQEVLNKDKNVNSLMLRNQLICELEKIPIHSEAAVKHIVEEIKMKQEVAEFFNKNSLNTKDKFEEQVLTSLAKKLFEIERTGHTCNNERKMKAAIFKHIKKIGKELSSDEIDAFLTRLKESEPYRKAQPLKNTNIIAYASPNQIHHNNTSDWMSIQNEYLIQQGVPHRVQLSIPTSPTSQGLPPESFQGNLGNLQNHTQNQFLPSVGAAPIQILGTRENFPSSTCRNPCSVIINSGHADPCNTERFWEKNQILTRIEQGLDSFDTINVTSKLIEPQFTMNQPVHDNYQSPQIPLHFHNPESNIQAQANSYIPNNSQVQIPNPNTCGQCTASRNPSMQPVVHKIPPCCQKAELNKPLTAAFISNSNQIQNVDQSLTEKNTNIQINHRGTFVSSIQPSRYQDINTPHLPVPSTQNNPSCIIQTELPTVDTFKKPITNVTCDDLMSSCHRRQSLKRNMKLRDSIESADVIEKQRLDDILCKCRRRARRKKCYGRKFEMCFGRLPKCFYY